MIKISIFVIVLLVIVGCTAGQSLRVTTPFDLVRDSAYSQVSQDLEEIMKIINETDARSVGTAATVILKVGKFFIDKNKADAKKQAEIAFIERQTERVLEALAEIKRLVIFRCIFIQDKLKFQFFFFHR
jgi:hypothetical protein